MRPLMVLFIPALVAGQGPWDRPAAAQTAALDVGHANSFALLGASSDDDALLPRSPPRFAATGHAILPSVNLGPFHATLGGMNGKHASLGSYELDTRQFWNSTISGSVDGRGARVTFTLPIQ